MIKMEKNLIFSIKTNKRVSLTTVLIVIVFNLSPTLYLMPNRSLTIPRAWAANCIVNCWTFDGQWAGGSSLSGGFYYTGGGVSSTQAISGYTVGAGGGSGIVGLPATDPSGTGWGSYVPQDEDNINQLCGSTSQPTEKAMVTATPQSKAMLTVTPGSKAVATSSNEQTCSCDPQYQTCAGNFFYDTKTESWCTDVLPAPIDFFEDIEKCMHTYEHYISWPCEIAPFVPLVGELVEPICLPLELYQVPACLLPLPLGVQDWGYRTAYQMCYPASGYNAVSYPQRCGDSPLACYCSDPRYCP